MEINKIKVSELPIEKSLDGVWLHGYKESGDLKTSVRVPSNAAMDAFTEDIKVNIKEGKTFGKWVKGDIIPAKGKTARQVIIEALSEVEEAVLDTIYFGDGDEKPQVAAQIKAMNKTTDATFVIHPAKSYNTIAYPTAKYELGSVVSENAEIWTKMYKDSTFNLSIDGVAYTVHTMFTLLAMDIDATVILKEIK